MTHTPRSVPDSVSDKLHVSRYLRHLELPGEVGEVLLCLHQPLFQLVPSQPARSVPSLLQAGSTIFSFSTSQRLSLVPFYPLPVPDIAYHARRQVAGVTWSARPCSCCALVLVAARNVSTQHQTRAISALKHDTQRARQPTAILSTDTNQQHPPCQQRGCLARAT
eukprot:2591795-Rhodomonas_salina.4